MFDKLGNWIMDLYWRHWQFAHGVDPENPPEVDISFLYEDDEDGTER